MLSNTFTNNQAQYGPDFASFPMSVNITSFDKITVASGQKYSGTIKVNLIDPDGQIVLNDNTSCIKCQLGYFSLQDNMTQCLECKSHSDCPGGYQVDVFPGYWRKSFYDPYIFKCLEATACIGGTYSFNKSQDVSQYPLCATGYGGNLCNRCQNDGDIIYSRSGLSRCERCPDPVLNTLLLQAIFFAIMGYILFMIVTNLKEDKNQESSAVLRILTNFLQIITSTSLIDLQWPQTLKSFYEAFSVLGESSNRLISFDCFVQTTILFNDSNSLVYFKTLLIGLLPFCILVIYEIIIGLSVLFRGLSKETFKKWSIVALIVIIYFLHPQVTKYMLQMFFCIDLQGTYYLQQDMEVQCWTGDHLKFCLTIGLPFIFFWVLLAPLLAFLHLFRNREKLQVLEFKQRYQTLYLGLKEECFYWEFINICRKVFLVAVNIFLQTQVDFFKALVTLLVLIIILGIQNRITPYKNPLINTLEKREIQCSIVTFFGALYFLSEDLSPFIKIVVFLVIILYIIWFFVLWLYCLLYCQKSPFLRKIAQFIRCLTLLPISETENLNLDSFRFSERTNRLQDLSAVFETLQQNEPGTPVGDFNDINIEFKQGKHISMKGRTSKLAESKLANMNKKQVTLQSQSLYDIFQSHQKVQSPAGRGTTNFKSPLSILKNSQISPTKKGSSNLTAQSQLNSHKYENFSQLTSFQKSIKPQSTIKCNYQKRSHFYLQQQSNKQGKSELRSELIDVLEQDESPQKEVISEFKDDLESPQNKEISKKKSKFSQKPQKTKMPNKIFQAQSPVNFTQYMKFNIKSTPPLLIEEFQIQEKKDKQSNQFFNFISIQSPINNMSFQDSNFLQTPQSQFAKNHQQADVVFSPKHNQNLENSSVHSTQTREQRVMQILEKHSSHYQNQQNSPILSSKSPINNQARRKSLFEKKVFNRTPQTVMRIIDKNLQLPKTPQLELMKYSQKLDIQQKQPNLKNNDATQNEDKSEEQKFNQKEKLTQQQYTALLRNKMKQFD
eukprot:403344138